MSNGTRDFIKRFALQNLNYYIDNLMDSNCRKTESTPQDIADCKAVRSSSIHVAEDSEGFFENSVRIAFETAGKEGWFGNYGSRKMSILFRQDGSFVKAELQNPHSFLLPNGGNVGVGCTAGVIRDIPTGDAASLDAGGKSDGGSETSDVTQPQSDASSDVCQEDGLCMADISEVADDVPYVEDASTDSGLDLAGDVTDTDGMELPPDMSVNDASDAEDAIQDAAADLSEDATAADGTELPPDMSVDDTVDAEDSVQDADADMADDATAADGVELPPDDASVDVAIQDTAVEDVAAPICQYFCDSGISADLPADVSVAEDVNAPSGPVFSNMCSTPLGPQTISAPPNSVAAACTSGDINSLILGAKGCVPECGFYDNNVILSTNPNNPVKFAMNLFAPLQGPMQPYTITLSFNAPILSGGVAPIVPGFMNSSIVFVYQKGSFENAGVAMWESQVKDDLGNPAGKVWITYQPNDFIYGITEFLDIAFTDLTGKSAGYRFPCDQLVDSQGNPNAVINCAEVN